MILRFFTLAIAAAILASPLAADEFTMSADFLYWRAIQNGFEDNCRPNVNGKWDPGVRVGLEYGNVCTDWTALAIWTHLDNTKHGKNDSNFAKWHLEYDTVDLLFKYEGYKSSCFSYIPFIGVRAVRIDEKLKAHFTDCGCSVAAEARSIFDQSHKERLLAAGPELGIEFKWNVKCNFSFFGSIGGGLLYGNTKGRVQDVVVIPGTTDGGTCCPRFNVDNSQLFGDAAIGIQWEGCLCQNIATLIKFGFEHHRYFNNDYIGNHGDLSFDGLFLSLGVRF